MLPFFISSLKAPWRRPAVFIRPAVSELRLYRFLESMFENPCCQICPGLGRAGELSGQGVIHICCVPVQEGPWRGCAVDKELSETSSHICGGTAGQGQEPAPAQAPCCSHQRASAEAARKALRSLKSVLWGKSSRLGLKAQLSFPVFCGRGPSRVCLKLRLSSSGWASCCFSHLVYLGCRGNSHKFFTGFFALALGSHPCVWL